MGFRNIFDTPLFGDHSPLVLGWSDDQLWPVVDRLADVLPPNLTEGMQLAIASCALSIAVEKQLTGRWVHFPRAKEAYRVPTRYRRCGPRYTWHYITHAMDILQNTGLIEQVQGMWCQGGTGRQSIATATDRLMNLLGPLIAVEEQRALPSREETIVLRDRADKAPLDYDETGETSTMRAQVETVNEALSRLDLRLGGSAVKIPVGRRIFNGSFDRGGRFYCRGPSFQNMPAEQRRQLELVIGGVAHPLVEIDYCTLHVTMAYRAVGKRMRPGDQYAIAGFDRGLVKVAVNTMLNANTEVSAVRAITEDLVTNHERRADSGLTSKHRSECHTLARRVVAAIKDKHERIDKYFGSVRLWGTVPTPGLRYGPAGNTPNDPAHREVPAPPPRLLPGGRH